MGESHAPRVSVVEDDEALSRAVRRLLDAEGHRVASYESGEAFLSDFDPSIPGCILLDGRLPGVSGIGVLLALASRESAVPVIFLTGQADARTAVRAMRRGAVELLEKPFEAEELLRAVGRAIALDAARRREREARADGRSRLARLTPREHEVLALLLRGRLNKQIAGELGISQRTVEVHRYRLMRKLGADSLVDLVALALRADDDCLPESLRSRALSVPSSPS